MLKFFSQTRTVLTRGLGRRCMSNSGSYDTKTPKYRLLKDERDLYLYLAVGISVPYSMCESSHRNFARKFEDRIDRLEKEISTLKAHIKSKRSQS